MKRGKKTTIVFLSLMLLLVANFSVAMAYQYSFTIFRGQTAETGTKAKTKTAKYGKVSVISTSGGAGGYYTTYCILTQSNVRATNYAEVKNLRGQNGFMNYSNPYLIANVKLRGADARLTAPNNSKVMGMWSPTENITP